MMCNTNGYATPYSVSVTLLIQYLDLLRCSETCLCPIPGVQLIPVERAYVSLSQWPADLSPYTCSVEIALFDQLLHPSPLSNRRRS